MVVYLADLQAVLKAALLAGETDCVMAARTAAWMAVEKAVGTVKKWASHAAVEMAVKLAGKSVVERDVLLVATTAAS